MSSTTTTLVDRLMGLWASPPSDDAVALAEFEALYTDPVEINGTAMTPADLLARARVMQDSYTGLRHHLLERVEAPGQLAIAFRLSGTHTGPLPTPLGTVAASGRPIDVRVIDILTLTGGRISRVVMVADELGLLHGIGAVAMAGATAP